MSTERFFRFHPVTKEDANDLPTEKLNIEQKQELAQMIRHGARFYWEPTSDEGPAVVQGYSRIEYANVKFVLDVTGQSYEFVDTHP